MLDEKKLCYDKHETLPWLDLYYVGHCNQPNSKEAIVSSIAEFSEFVRQALNAQPFGTFRFEYVDDEWVYVMHDVLCFQYSLDWSQP